MKQKRELIFLAVLVVIAAVVWYYFYFHKQGLGPGSANIATVGKYELLGIDNPGLHWPELLRAQKTEYKCGPCRNPFSKEAARPVEPVKVADASHLPVGPQQPAPIPPPTLPGNLKFFGYGTVPNGTVRRAFFSDGEDVIIVSEGETLLGRFRILKVNNTDLEFEEMATGRRNTAPLVEDQPSQPST